MTTLEPVAARTASYSDPEEWADIARTVTDREGLTVDAQARYARTDFQEGECARGGCEQECERVLTCCDCGIREDGCGCQYCWSCNACDTCY